jgi:hypothetical protein
MTDPEREHFVRWIRDLERRLRRWRLACLALLALLLLPTVLGGLLGVWWAPRLEAERAFRLQMEHEREWLQQDTYQRLVQVEQEARREAERQKALAEEEVRRLRARQGPGEDKEEQAHASR